jgi:putative hydrolase of HD superfamily
MSPDSQISIEQIFSFIIEIEKLKAVLRKTKPVGLDRYENSAEHSWHVCLTALLFKDYANESLDIERIIKMLLLHDLGEIDTGDTIVYAAETPEVKAAEVAAVQRILSLFPEPLSQELWLIWEEFEAGITPEAVYAKAIDRVPPLLHNLYGNGHSWKDNNISAEQIYAVNSRIEKGSKPVWQYLKAKISQAEAEGVIH